MPLTYILELVKIVNLTLYILLSYIILIFIYILFLLYILILYDLLYNVIYFNYICIIKVAMILFMEDNFINYLPASI